MVRNLEVSRALQGPAVGLSADKLTWGVSNTWDGIWVRTVSFIHALVQSASTGARCKGCVGPEGCQTLSQPSRSVQADQGAGKSTYGGAVSHRGCGHAEEQQGDPCGLPVSHLHPLKALP